MGHGPKLEQKSHYSTCCKTSTGAVDHASSMMPASNLWLARVESLGLPARQLLPNAALFESSVHGLVKASYFIPSCSLRAYCKLMKRSSTISHAYAPADLWLSVYEDNVDRALLQRFIAMFNKSGKSLYK